MRREAKNWLGDPNKITSAFLFYFPFLMAQGAVLHIAHSDCEFTMC
jgi:hypothetical protein